MKAELKKWLEYLQKIEPPEQDKSLLTEFQKKDIEFTKIMIEKLRGKKMKEMKKNKKDESLPIATEILKDYKKVNKRLFTIVAILLAIIFIETSYLIVLLDGLNTSVGVITEEVRGCG